MAFRPGYIQGLRMRAIEALGGRCFACGDNNPDHLHIHHIRAISVSGGYRGRGSYNRARSLRQDVEEEKVMVICNWCHEKLHRRVDELEHNVFGRFRHG